MAYSPVGVPEKPPMLTYQAAEDTHQLIYWTSQFRKAEMLIFISAASEPICRLVL
jgi:hypothetical protein